MVQWRAVGSLSFCRPAQSKTDVKAFHNESNTLLWFWDGFHLRIIQALEENNKECAILKWPHNTFPVLCRVVNARSIVYIREKAKKECLGQFNLLPLI